MGDEIFHFGEAAESMIIINGGVVKYSWASGSDVQLRVGEWLSEAVLWTQWAHHGDLVAMDNCRYFNLVATEFQQIVTKFELSDFNPLQYANYFLRCLNEANFNDVSDLAPEQMEFDDIDHQW